MQRVIVCADGDEGYWSQLDDALFATLDAAGVRLVWHHGEPPDEDAWLERIGDSEALLLFWALPDAVLRAAPRLRAISWVGTGVGSSVNLSLARELGVQVSNTPGYGDNAVAEHALGLMLALARGTVRWDGALRAGGWPRDEIRGVELAGMTLGIVGLGGIGTRLAQLAGALGMRVLAWNRSPAPERFARAGAERATLAEVVARADVLSLHLVATPATVGILSRELLATMKPGAYLVNTARGELIDEAALVDALHAGRLAGAALDVYATEPLSVAHPFRTLDNVVLTPHVGFRTPAASKRSLDIALDNLLAYFAGESRNVVNRA